MSIKHFGHPGHIEHEHTVVFERQFGKIPQNLGDYNPKESYGVKERVFQYGCELQSLIDNNTNEPIFWGGGDKFVISPYWKLVTGSPRIWAYENGHIDFPGGAGKSDVIKRIIERLNLAAGELPEDVTLYIAQRDADGGKNVDVSASISDGVFETIELYVGSDVKSSEKKVDSLTKSVFVNKATVVRVVFTILGIKYSKSVDVVVSTEPDEYDLYIGSGSSWSDVVNDGNRIKSDANIYKEYSVNIKNDGDLMFVVLPIAFNGKIGNITMSDFKIPMEVVTTGDYLVYKSLNQYRAGTYPIKIVK